MVPNAPPNTVLDVKKSSYKKLSKFLEEKERNGVIHIKELQKGVESIVGVEYEHEFILQHRVVRYQKGEQM
jgi:translation initiation factor 2D